MFASKKHKLVFVGDSNVGKTAIVSRMTYDSFDPVYQATVGIDFFSKTILLENNRSVRLQIWDTAGQERYQSLIPSYLRDSTVAVLVYDVTNRKSFGAIDSWAEAVHGERGKNVLMVLVGNKTDLDEKRQVTTQEGETKAQSLDCLFMETSARLGLNIKTLFRKIAVQISDEPIDVKNQPETQYIEVDVVKYNAHPTATQPSAGRRVCDC